MSFTFYISLILILTPVFSEKTEIVTTKNGQIEGRILKTYLNKTFYAFQEIPYAEKPIGELRFEFPVPVKNWTGVLNCTKNTKICYQLNEGNDEVNEEESEDCLYLNVYTPVNPGSADRLAVLFYIHGGGFLYGNAKFSTAGPHYFINNDVVVVTVQYRMGAFGFLSTSDTVIPGNNGLRDQQLALKWVQDNIELFGGNPQKVTIMGQSAGAAAVTYQMLNQNSDGLYRAAIGQSGSFLNTWAYTSSTKDTAFELGRELNFTGNTSEDLKKFLKIQSAVDIKIAATHVYSNNAVKGFLPSIEIDHVDAFVTQPMYEQLVEGRINKNIPVIMGTTSEEMIAKLIGGIDVFKTTLKDYDDDLSGLVYRNMHLNDSKVKTIVGREIRSIYTNGTFENHIQEGVKYFTDSYFSKAVMRFAELYSKYSDVYFYKFSYSGPLGHNPSPKLPGIGKVMHSEDNYYLWVTNGDDADIFNYSERDIATSNKYVDMFTYFTKNLIPWEAGNKNLSWPKLSCESFTFLDIDEILTVKENPRGPAYKKWVELYEKWAVKPLDSF